MKTFGLARVNSHIQAKETGLELVKSCEIHVQEIR